MNTVDSTMGHSHFLRQRGADWTLTLKNLLLPMYCKGCDARLLTEDNAFFCPDCWESSPRIERPFCIACGKPHNRMVGLGERSNYPCASCREKPNPWLRRIRGAAYYDGAVGLAIRLFKFRTKPRLARPLGALMLEFAENEMDLGAYDCIVPVPLFKVRLRERGFNQSLLLVRTLAEAAPQVVIEQSLQRIRPTRAQSTLKHEERATNVRGAFAVTGDAFQGKTVLLVDDVITSAGTVTECARVLKRAGALEVDAFAVALATPTIRYHLE